MPQQEYNLSQKGVLFNELWEKDWSASFYTDRRTGLSWVDSSLFVVSIDTYI
jgi:hypothetical protein